jgi:carbonic anhydrase/acetyltransferase-like protein (isoleucine patch superfamily)
VPRDIHDLTRSLDRARGALARARRGNAAVEERKKGPGPAATAFGALALVLFVIGFLTGNHALVYVAMAAAAAGGLLFASPQARDLLGGLAGQGGKGQAHVGMGASVAGDAVLEPGARVEMGASVGARAVLRADAVVRMGASVGAGAVLERGAVVSWGASVHDGAVVEEGATVGAGSDVLSGARVPAGMWLRPGSTFGGGSPAAAVVPAALPRATDPRAARLAAVCDKLEAELRVSPERVREFLGGSGETVATLRSTCEDLARRERELRTEADAGARLDEERSALETRIASERDEQTASSLRGAIAAIDEQKRQREILKVRAERLDAEQTRLLYTLEGLASQFVRLRTSGMQPGAGAEVDSSVAQLRNELDAIADALDDVTLGTSAESMRAAAEAPATRGEQVRGDRTRTRD